jgi:hypothetical protein
MQGGGDRKFRRRARRQHCGDLVVAIGAFEDRFGQLFDEERHAVGALDDLAKTGIAGKLLDQRRPSRPPSRFSASIVTCG